MVSTSSHVLVAGGGVAALEAMLALRHFAEERVSIELVAPEPQFWYRPLAVGEPFELGTVHGIELGELTRERGATFTLGAVAAVDPDAHVASTSAGAELRYDFLLVASGARPMPAVPGALTFRGPADTEAFRRLLGELERGEARSVVFAVPGGVTWPLPLYELALQTATHLDRRSVTGVEITFVTHEDAPLHIFGANASKVVGGLLEQRGITVRTGTYAGSFEGGALELVPGGAVAADRVVALPRLQGTPPAGLPHDPAGFIATDDYGHVRDIDDVFAAGDATTCPVKQGGLAAQQADAAALAIAALAGAPVEREPFRPVLRGLILTGGAPAFVRAELAGGRGETSIARHDALWWPPGKIVGRHLAPFLAERAGLVLTPPVGESVPVDADL